MDKPLTVAVLAGGLSHERDISLQSGRRIAAALTDSGIQAKVLDVDSQLLQRLEALEPDVAWPLLHGSTGEDGSLQDLLSLIGLPFVGSDAVGCRLAADKAVAASVLAGSSVHVPESTALPQSLFRDVGAGRVLDLIEERYGFPVVIKPTKSGSSLGLTIVRSKAELPGAMVDCFAYGDTALIQKFVEGREFGVAVVDFGEGPVALPPVEVVASGPYDFDARYNPGRVQYFVPARVTEKERDVVAQLAVDVHRSLGLKHLSRTDIILDADGVAWFVDVNTSPGMTETSLFPLAVQAYAADRGEAVESVYLQILARAGADADADE
ncbi:D-alanine-D-alanine ligase [Arcanobacterium wilhelmae]|uniref:D-alanine--D-alanine ligase n=1 Tax=Arcanobacterium wilhelmae TaxID=1803177 RepID=A0ABT9NB12_9ACTO|nr:D-alanine--D-alanine ligase [Arcanobacterium wilhelmae]MDP9800903.1 D-alanine-D-alanine ligase [Arcanobacterium wilhelmae]WFN90269.1 D-alanine--D-alanine ligase [Arcanobacterium wilhelmae]